MQIVIPIEDTSSGNDKVNHCARPQEEELEVEHVVESAALERKTGGLSEDLRDQFETMKSIWRQARRDTGDERICPSKDRSDGRQVMVKEDLKRKERETAVETAIKVQSEIEAWQNGIADLEALLAAEEEDDVDEWGGLPPEDGDENGPPGIREIAFVRRVNNAPRRQPPPVRFPCLPPAIPTEDETTEEEEELVTLSTAASSRVSKSSY